MLTDIGSISANNEVTLPVGAPQYGTTGGVYRSGAYLLPHVCDQSMLLLRIAPCIIAPISEFRPFVKFAVRVPEIDA